MHCEIYRYGVYKWISERSTTYHPLMLIILPLFLRDEHNSAEPGLPLILIADEL